MEQWKQIPGLPSFWEASNQGRVRVLDRTVTSKTGVKRPFAGRIQKFHDRRERKQLMASAQINGKVRTLYLHRAIALTWIPNPGDHPYIHFRDGDLTNCLPGNLIWSAHRTGPTPDCTIRHIRQEFAEGSEIKSLVDKYALSMPSLRSILRGITYAHAGGPTIEKVKPTFTASEIRDIRRRAESGVMLTTMAKELRVDLSTISRICSRHTYKNVMSCDPAQAVLG